MVMKKMEKMKNVEVVENFVRMGENCQNNSEIMRSVDGKLYNYTTVIAQFTKYGLTINDTKYSVVTSKVQNLVKRVANGYYTVSNVVRGCHDLTPYVEKLLENVEDKEYLLNC
jgi:hypothetical protein